MLLLICTPASEGDQGWKRHRKQDECLDAALRGEVRAGRQHAPHSNTHHPCRHAQAAAHLHAHEICGDAQDQPHAPAVVDL